MADVITRFKLETNQFDSALRNAANGLTDITKQLSLAGKDFDKFAQKHVESARSLGQVESGANNLKDKLRDLVSAYNNVAKAYNNLTNEQQQGDFGKAMAASLDQLQSRITQTKNELYSMSDSTKQAGGSLGSLNDIFGMSITKLAGWGTAIAAAKGALDVAKDAFFASEQNLDDWNRTVYTAQSTYEAFLTSLNTSDVSGFMDRIGQITKAAMDAYNAIDRLQTTQNVQTPQVAKRQSELNRFEAMLRTGRYIAPIDGRKATPGLKDGDKLTKEQKERVANQVENIIKELAGLTKNEVNAATDAINKLFNEQSLRLGMSKQKFLAGTETIGTFEQNVDLGKKYQEWEINRQTAIDLAKAGHYDMMSEEQKRYINTTNPYQQYKGWSIFKDDGELYQTILTNIKNRTAKEQEYYSMLARSYRQINRVEGYKPYGSNGSEKTETELKQNEAAVAKLTEEYQKLATDAKTANDVQLSGIKERQTAIQTEIANLKTRNEELKKFAAEAQGIQVNIGMNSSLPDLTAKLKELQAAQSQALNGTEWQEYQKQIEQVGLQIDAMKGKWKDGMKATISVNTESIQKAIGESSKLQDLIIKPKKQTSTAAVESNANNVAADASKLEDVITKPRKGTATIDSNIKEVEADASKLEDVITKPKTGKVTITADTTDAKAKVEEVDAMFGDKTAKVTFTADSAEVLQKAAQIDGIQIDPKTLTVTALTADAENALSNIEGLTLQPKELDITADVQKVLDAITQIDGVTVDPKTLEITAGTAEAYAKLQELFANIEGTTVSFNVEPKQREMETGVSITNAKGMSSYISQLKSDLAEADFGSDIYNSIAAKLTDMTSLSNLVAESLKAGLGTALFDAADILGEDFWTRAMEGGVEDIDWQGIVDKINEKLKEMDLKPISLDFETGNIDGGKDEKGTKAASGKDNMSQLISNVHTITRCLEDMGIEVPAGFTKVISSMNLVTTILQTIQSITTASSAMGKGGGIIGLVGSLFSSIFGGFFAGGGLVPHAANGMVVPGNDHMDRTLIAASSGELILNAAQQNTVAGLLTAAPAAANIGRTEAYIESDQIRICLLNGAQAKGMTLGQYLGIGG